MHDSTRRYKKRNQKRPPLQRDDAQQNYRGIKVSWVLSFQGAHELRNNSSVWRIRAIQHDNFFPDVCFDVNKSENPEFAILHQDTTFWIEGEIAEVVGHGTEINLKNCVVRFTKEYKKTEPTPIQNNYMNSQIHYGAGDIVTGDKKQVLHIEKQIQKQPWYKKMFWRFIIPTLVVIIAGAVLYFKGWN